jgi:ubiquinone/menaquinone biosynthesis C-methylase UbiE
MRRKATPEWLDDDLGTPEEVAASLADLRAINRRFGGNRTTLELLRRVASAGEQELSLLEVGAAQGEAPRAAQRALARAGTVLEVTLLDRKRSHLPSDGVSCVVGDTLRLPFHEGAFDVVSCSLLLHHFGPEEIVGFAREALRVCRRAVLVNDLIRSRIHLALVYLGLPLFRSRLTSHDAPASVRAAYTREEMRRLLAAVPARRIEISRHYLYRMGVLLWK